MTEQQGRILKEGSGLLGPGVTMKPGWPRRSFRIRRRAPGSRPKAVNTQPRPDIPVTVQGIEQRTVDTMYLKRY